MTGIIAKAAEFAEKAHSGAFRKGTTIPYITHPLEAAVIMSMMTDDEEMVAAALLHDTMEDAGVTYGELEAAFGARVADLVAEESEDKSKAWQERKSATIRRLETAGRDARMLALADKLSNIRCIARDYLLEGERVWERFRVRDKERQAWYYTSMEQIFSEFSEMPQYREYAALCRQVFGTAVS